MFNFTKKNTKKMAVEAKAREIAAQMILEEKKNNIESERARMQTAEERRRREIEFGINSQKSLNSMKSLAKKLEKYRVEYLTKAKEATLNGNESACKIAKIGLKRCLSKQRFIEQNIERFEMALQDMDMTKTMGEFAHAVMDMTTQMKEMNPTVDLVSAHVALQNMMEENQKQFEELDLAMAQTDSLESFAEGSNITDEEIDRLIRMEAVNAEAGIDAELDSQIQAMGDEIRSKIVDR